MKIAILLIGILVLSTLLLSACSVQHNNEKVVDNVEHQSQPSSDEQIASDIVIPEDDQVEIGELI